MARPPEGAQGGTAFDAAVDFLFDWERNGGRSGFSLGLALLKPLTQLDAPDVPEAVCGLLRVTVDEALSGTNRFLTGMAIQALALDYLREDTILPEIRESATRGRAEARRWAAWTLDKRRGEWHSTTSAYESLLSICFLHLRRRPLPDYSVGDIVRSMQALWAGSIFRALTEPAQYAEYWEGDSRKDRGRLSYLPKGNGRIERAMFGLILGMTQPGVFSTKADPSERGRIIHAALTRYASGDAPVTLRKVARTLGVEVSVVNQHFADASLLAEACFDQLGGGWLGFTDFAESFTTDALPAVEALLIWISQVDQDHPGLFSAFAFDTNSGAFIELTDIVARVLTRERVGETSVVPPSARKKSERLIRLAATGGGSWRAELTR